MDYSEEVRRRFGAPGRVAASGPCPPTWVAGEAEDQALGVWARFRVQIRADAIEAVSFHLFGCPHTIAAASLLAERLEGEPATALRGSWAHALAAELAVPAEKLGRLLVLEDALRACARNFEQG